MDQWKEGEYAGVFRLRGDSEGFSFCSCRKVDYAWTDGFKLYGNCFYGLSCGLCCWRSLLPHSCWKEGFVLILYFILFFGGDRMV